MPLVGATIYPYWQNGSGPAVRAEGWLDPAFPAYLRETFAMFRETLNASVVRIDDFLAASPSPLNETVLVNVGAALSLACTAGLQAIIDLSTFRNFLERSPDVMPYNPALWFDFLDAFVPRFAASPCLLNWAIAGEPPAPNFGPPSPAKPTTAQLTAFYAAVSSRIRALDSNPAHGVTPGGFLFTSFTPAQSGIDWPAICSLQLVTACAMHSYSDDDRNAGMAAMTAWAAAARRPWLLEEFGFEQGAQAWEGQNTTGDSGRAAAYNDTFSRALCAAKPPASLAVVWNGGGEYAAGSCDVGGEPWTSAAAAAVRRAAGGQQCADVLCRPYPQLPVPSS
jgi:hypothetical protein